MRERILDEPERFDEALTSLHFVDAELDRTQRVRTMPRGFADASDHRHADVIALTQLLAMRPIPVSSFLEDTAIDRIVEFADAVKPLYRIIGHDV